MIKKLFIAAAVLASLSAQAANERWLDPQVNRVNVLPSRSTFFAYEDSRHALASDMTKSERYLSMEGQWKFHFVKDHNLAPRGFYAVGYDDAAWDNFPVPGLFEVNGYGDRIYKNVGYAWATQFRNNPPMVEEKNNNTGSYRREFMIPASWKGQQVVVHVGSATSNLTLWVNGKEVGYSEDSKMAAEFDITPYVTPGQKALVAMQVMRWCDGSYGEDQDFWRFTGIAREVYMYARPTAHIEDVFITPDLTDNYTKGKLNVRITGNRASAGKTVSVELQNPNGGRELSQQVTLDKNGSANVDLTLNNPQKWSAETPSLYNLMLTLTDKQGTVEVIPQRVGFRKVEHVGQQILVNGKPVLFKGVDRHELDPDGGYVVSRERMIQDIQRMKELNVNAVRTCHYPDDPRWYDLCDEYGIYMVAEANFESHGMGYGDARLAQDSRYHNTIVERNMNNVRSFKNHPAVIFWSLGNESGYGKNFEDAYDAIKAYDPSRPVQYEQAGRDGKTEVFCPMYLNHAECEKYCQGSNPRPLIQCEYNHTMGNSGGGFAEYWALIRKYPNFQGGFIWDFIDQGLRGVSKVTGKQIWMYGGDEGRYPASDHNFNCNGVLLPDRTPNPHAAEIRYCHQNFWLQNLNINDGSIELYNENFFTDMKNIRTEVSILVDGKVEAVYDLTSVAQAKPQEHLRINLAQLPLAMDVYRIMQDNPNAEILANIDFKLIKPEPLLPAGYLVAYQQFTLQQYQFPTAEQLISAATSAPAVSVDSMLACYTLEANGLSVTINRSTGMIDYLDHNGKPMLEPGYSVTPNFWRAPTDNDYGASLQQKFAQFKSPELRLKAIRREAAANGAQSVVADIDMPSLKGGLTLTYTMTPAGELIVRQQMRNNPEKQNDNMFRYGMQWVMPEQFDQVNYYGRGPVENYIDRCQSQRLGIYTGSVAEQYHPYVRPQESGNHVAVREWSVVDKAGRGLHFVATGDMECSTLPYLPQDLDDGMNKAAVQHHSGDLTPRHFSVTQVQQRQFGVGGVNSWGTWPLGQYHLNYKPYDFTYIVTAE